MMDDLKDRPFNELIKLLKDYVGTNAAVAELASVKDASTPSRWIKGSSRPLVRLLVETIVKNLTSPPNALKTGVDKLLSDHPHFGAALLDAYDVDENLKDALQWKVGQPVHYKKTIDYGLRRISRQYANPALIRDNLEYKCVTAPTGPDTPGFRLQHSTVSWDGVLPEGPLCVSFVCDEDQLQSEFRDATCIYREEMLGLRDILTGDSFEQFITERALRADVEIKSENECLNSVGTFRTEDTGVLRAYFDVDVPAGERVRVTVRITSPQRLDVDHLFVKFDGYDISGGAMITFKPPVPLDAVECYGFAGSIDQGAVAERQWHFEYHSDGTIVAHASLAVLAAGSGVYFDWAHDYKVKAFRGDVDDVQRIQRRSRELFGRRAVQVLREKPALSHEYLSDQLSKGLLFGIYQTYRPRGPRTADAPPRSKDDVLVGFAACHWNGPTLHLEQVSMLPELTGQRLGRMLIRHVLTVGGAAQADAVTLMTFSDVAWNGPMYAELGFVALEDDDLTASQHDIVSQDRAAFGGHPELASKRVLMRHPLGNRWRVAPWKDET